jgi:hypothetical protein
MRSSTIIQPCNTSGFLNASLYSQFGVVSIDWSNAKQLWVNPPMSCEELLVEQASLLKAARPGVRVMGYRNIIKSLPWFSSVREKMDDPKYASWFLPFDVHNKTPYHVPQCDNNFNPPSARLYTMTLSRLQGFPVGMVTALALVTVACTRAVSTSLTTSRMTLQASQTSS